MYATRFVNLLIVACTILSARGQDDGAPTGLASSSSAPDSSSVSSSAAVVSSGTASGSSASGPASTTAVVTTTTTTTTSQPVSSTSSSLSSSLTSSAAGASSASTANSLTSSGEEGPTSTTPVTTQEPDTTTTRAASSHVTSAPDHSAVSHTRIVSTQLVFITHTNKDGTKSTQTSTRLTTQTAGFSTDGPSMSAGMSPKTRNTIIGVVVGIGGAIILGGLGLVAWRIWGRKKNMDEAEGFMAYGQNEGYQGIEKSDHGSISGNTARSPFQSNLESHHAPSSGPVNASSNF